MRTGSITLLLLAGCSNASGSNLGISGTACASPVEITAGGSFSGNTCQSSQSIQVQGCAGASTAQIFAVRGESQSWNRVFHVTDGFSLAASAPAACDFSATDCDAGGIGAGGVPQDTPWYLAAFAEDGGCGAFTLDVYNATSCADRSDASTCTCGSGPACPVGQTCHLNEMPLTGTCVQN